MLAATASLLVWCATAAPPLLAEVDFPSYSTAKATAPPSKSPSIHANWPQSPQVHPASATSDWPALERLPNIDLSEPARADNPFDIDHLDLPGQYGDTHPLRLWNDLWQDQVNFYSWETLRPSLLMFGAGAALANTSVDQQFRNWWQQDVHSSGVRNAALTARDFGEGKYLIPAVIGLWVGGELLGDMPGAPAMAQWGGRSTRSILVGFPSLLVMQRVTGASRPGDGLAHPSHWNFWQDNNGVSGHAFMGAIPFLAAAQLVEDPWMKGTLFAGSTLVALSRVETDSHYLSQVILGWWMAYMATSAVQRTALENSAFSVDPLLMSDGMGLSFSYRR